MKKEYSKEGVTVIWEPDKCSHSTKCFHGLPEVFNPAKRPWISIERASSETIIKQVHVCPSGALKIKDE